MQCLIKRQLTACTSHPHKDDSILDKKNLYYIAMMMRKTWYFPCYCQRLCHFYFTTVVRMKVQIFVWQKKTTPSPFCGIYLMLWMRSDNPTITKFFFSESEPFSMFSNTNSTNTFAFGYVTLHPIIWIPYVIYGCIILWTASGLQISNGLRVKLCHCRD